MQHEPAGDERQSEDEKNDQQHSVSPPCFRPQGWPT
jgi:hypothetical protein